MSSQNVGKQFIFLFLTIPDVTDRFSRNVGKICILGILSPIRCDR